MDIIGAGRFLIAICNPNLAFCSSKSVWYRLVQAKAVGQNTIGRGGQQKDFLLDRGEKGGNQESSIL